MILFTVPSPKPTPEPSLLAGPTFSPTPAPTPAVTPEPTSAPGGPRPDDGRRDLSPYGIAYTVTRPGIPGVIDYAEVALLTNDYLETYFGGLFADTIFTRLDNFFTIFVTGSFSLNQPIRVDYESIAYFDVAESVSIPTVDDLDILLRLAFEGENLEEYLAQLSTLTSNIFSTTTNAQVVNSTSARLNDQQRQQGQNAILGRNKSHGTTPSAELIATIFGISAGALAFGALVLFFTKRRQRRDSSPTLVKILDSPPPAPFTGNDDDDDDQTAGDTSSNGASFTDSQSAAIYLSETRFLTENDDFEPEFVDSHGRNDTSPLFASPQDTDMDGGDFKEVEI